MRKNRYRYYLQLMVAALLFTSLFSSCILEDEILQTGETGFIIVNLATDGVKTRAAGDPLFTDDAVITKARIFVFVGEALEVNQLFTSGNDAFNNPFVLEVATGTKDVYVVANETDGLGGRLAGVTTKTGLNAVMADEISSNLNLPLVMTGSKTGVLVDKPIDPDDNTIRNSTDITLTRIAAKISLKLKKDTDADVQITKLSLIDNTRKTPLWEDETIEDTQSYWNFEYTPSAITLSNDYTNIGLVYLYENLAGNKSNKATMLELEALYNGVSTRYRVYVNENVTAVVDPGDPSLSETNPSDHLYSIRRNHSYQIVGTIINIGEFDGLTLTTNVLPWNYLPAEYTFEHKYSINPVPTQTNHTYSTGTSGQVSFTFKLTDPIDATWVANLTNPTDFEFVGDFQGATDQEKTLTIKASNAAGTAVRTTELYINVIYGGNIVEVPLISGSNLVGEGNRIVINQPAIP